MDHPVEQPLAEADPTAVGHTAAVAGRLAVMADLTAAVTGPTAGRGRTAVTPDPAVLVGKGRTAVTPDPAVLVGKERTAVTPDPAVLVGKVLTAVTPDQAAPAV